MEAGPNQYPIFSLNLLISFFPDFLFFEFRISPLPTFLKYLSIHKTIFINS